MMVNNSEILLLRQLIFLGALSPTNVAARTQEHNKSLYTL